MNKFNLKNYGLNDRFLALANEHNDLYIARVISQSKGIYRVVSEEDEFFAEVSGKFRYDTTLQKDFPAVGDFVLLDRLNGKNGNGIIHHILQRKSAFFRKSIGNEFGEQVIATNIDIIFICMALNDDFNLRRLERYLAMAWESGATPIVVLTKSDLCNNISEKLKEVNTVAFGTTVIVTTSLKENGYKEVLEHIKPYLTVAFVGSSGVGKSTLINKLIGKEILETNTIRNDEKGRHTTTRRELILLDNGGLVIDTPGMREFGLIHASEGIDKSFEDIKKYLGKCQFRDCTHTTEPNCAIKKAIENGEILKDRWEAYNKLLNEMNYADDKETFMRNKEEKFKNISKINKRSKRK